jgi:ribosome-binding factor A
MGVRQERVQEQLVHELSEIIHRDLHDPRLGFVTLTGAEITRDLRYAKVYVSVMGDEEARNQCLKALQSATGLLRGEFTRRAHLRMAPELEFRFDPGIERGQRIFELLHSVESDLKPAEEPQPGPEGETDAAEQETHGQA